MTEPENPVVHDADSRISALTVQRDSAHRQLVRLETENRVLLAHQKDIREWLAEAIEEFTAVRNTSQVWEVADRIHRTAKDKLGDTQRLL